MFAALHTLVIRYAVSETLVTAKGPDGRRKTLSEESYDKNKTKRTGSRLSLGFRDYQRRSVKDRQVPKCGRPRFAKVGSGLRFALDSDAFAF